LKFLKILFKTESQLDKAHKVKVCIGNGTRANIHRTFSERFNVKCVEIYGATEGNWWVYIFTFIFILFISINYIKDLYACVGSFLTELST